MLGTSTSTTGQEDAEIGHIFESKDAGGRISFANNYYENSYFVDLLPRAGRGNFRPKPNYCSAAAWRSKPGPAGSDFAGSEYVAERISRKRARTIDREET